MLRQVDAEGEGGSESLPWHSSPSPVHHVAVAVEYVCVLRRTSPLDCGPQGVHGVGQL